MAATTLDFDGSVDGSRREPARSGGTVRLSLRILPAGVALIAAGSSHAQVANPPAAAPAPAAVKPKSGGKTVDAVTVMGASQSGFRSSIDRRSYGVANDLAATTGSISDALRNIPSVEVDAQGVVSLRGDTRVTIMIDGKPSTLFKGASAAMALQSMPADSVERVEVITNPSAEFSPEGSAGIINLVTKKVRKPGKSGSVRLNAGTGGRLNGAASAAYNSNKLTLSADLGAIGHAPQGSTGYQQEATFGSQGQPLATRTTLQTNTGVADQWNAHAGLDYDLDTKTRLSAEARYNRLTWDRDIAQHLAGYDPAGDLNQLFDGSTAFGGARNTGSVQATMRRSFAGDDHVLTVNVSHELTDQAGHKDLTEVTSLPPAPDFYSHVDDRDRIERNEAKADYTRPMPDGAKLKAGYDLRVDQNDYDTVGLRGTSQADAGPDPTQTDLFRYRQTINAAYASYERPFGDWTVLAGLRLEDVQLNLDQVTSKQRNDTSYFRAYPSLHVAYKFAQDQQLTLSYSERVQRPEPQDFNPFLVQGTPLDFNAGNPNLKPQFTYSYEAAYQYKTGQTYYLATLYYRRNRNGVVSVVTALDNGAFLNTKANLSDSQSAGLELVANGHLTKHLSYNVSSNLYWNEVDATRESLGVVATDFSPRRSAVAVGGRGSLTWQATPKDLFQLSGQVNAKRLTPQGYADPVVLAFLGYRHKFNDSLSAVVTVQDALNSLKFSGVTDTLTLHNRYKFNTDTRAAFVGLTWSFGSGSAKRPRDPGFDFDGGPH
jgi:outer membrane receptor protein involved in Fe transport